ncbi:hypothetical protein SAMN05444365_104478 [Micromonospora pattaloongensis]|uniref:CoA-binding domain-containing protein n=1 Tax=Micromonospora pattaloongensis TaxID=405436 RepID=A0A1H3PEQ1_9ACTN|nr:hypothetical protein [Micromonospora pattaloongensis]SDY99423.1 hypothetical protein SAMN05444365_104478 [Micromonospora pattaloongensis]
MPLISSAAASRGDSRPNARRPTAGLLVGDAAAWIGGFVVAVWTRFEFDFTGAHLARAVGVGLIAAIVHAALDTARRRCLGRYPCGSFEQLRALAGTTAVAGALVLVADLAARPRPVPPGAPAVGAALAFLVMIALRAACRRRHERSLRPDAATARPVLLFGVGAAGQGVLRAMVSDPRGGYRPVGLLDDDPATRRLRLEGVRVLGGRRDVPAAIARTGAVGVLFPAAHADPDLIREVRDAALGAGATFAVLPPVRELVRAGVTRARDAEIAELLGSEREGSDADGAPAGGRVPGDGQQRGLPDRIRVAPDHPGQSRRAAGTPLRQRAAPRPAADPR